MNDIERDEILLALKEASEKHSSNLVEITTVLKGYNGNRGLCKQVDDNSRAINRMWIALGIIGASVGGSAYGIVKALMG